MDIESPETTLQRREKLAQNNARIAQDFLNTLVELKKPTCGNGVMLKTITEEAKEKSDLDKAIFATIKHIQKKLEIA